MYDPLPGINYPFTWYKLSLYLMQMIPLPRVYGAMCMSLKLCGVDHGLFGRILCTPRGISKLKIRMSSRKSVEQVGTKADVFE